MITIEDLPNEILDEILKPVHFFWTMLVSKRWCALSKKRHTRFVEDALDGEMDAEGALIICEHIVDDALKADRPGQQFNQLQYLDHCGLYPGIGSDHLHIINWGEIEDTEIIRLLIKFAIRYQHRLQGTPAKRKVRYTKGRPSRGRSENPIAGWKLEAMIVFNTVLKVCPRRHAALRSAIERARDEYVRQVEESLSGQLSMGSFLNATFGIECPPITIIE